MGYRNSTLYTVKYVADMLGEDEDFLHNCSIEMFPEDGRLSAYDTFPASELTEHIEARRDADTASQKPPFKPHQD